MVDSDFTIAGLRDKLLEGEGIYNTVRPHQALGYLTPRQFLHYYTQTRERRQSVTNLLDEYTL